MNMPSVVWTVSLPSVGTGIAVAAGTVFLMWAALYIPFKLIARRRAIDRILADPGFRRVMERKRREAGY
jgi:hypothetical protein